MSRGIGAKTILNLLVFLAVLVGVFAFPVKADPGQYSVDIDWIVDPDAIYQTAGLLTSTNLLPAGGAELIKSFAYTATVPAGSALKIQFSKDGFIWYDSSGAANNLDTITAGTHTIDLSSLGWRSSYFYYKVLFTSDGQVTPELDQIILSYNQTFYVYLTYSATGSFTSTNFLSGITATSIDSFDYSLTSLPPNTTVEIQFSQDNSTWYSSANVLDGSDTLSVGTNTISLATLAWTGSAFYYKISMTSSDGLHAPEVDTITLNYTYEPNTAPSLTSISPTDPIKGVTTTTITPTGQADIDSDALYYYCNESGTATSANTLCTEANTSYASPYADMTCTYTVDTGDTTRTVYCRTYDSSEYSTERTDTYAVDTTNPITTADLTQDTNNITATLTCVDGAGSGCATTYYCYSSSTCTPTTVYSAPVSFTLSSDTSFRYYSIDNALNSAPTSGQALTFTGGGGPSGSINPNIEEWPTPPTGLIDQLKQQLQDMVNQLTGPQPKIVYPPISESVPEGSPPAMDGQWPALSPKQLEQIAVLPLPEKVKEFALKFPNFAETLEKVGINNPEDVDKLQIAKLNFPGMSGAVGLDKSKPLSEFTWQDKSRIPTNIVFGKIGNNNIDLNIKVQLAGELEPIQSIRTIQSKPLYLAVKPDKPAESVKGYIIFKSVSSEKSLRDFASTLSPALSASLMDAFNLPQDGPASGEVKDAEVKKELVLNQFDYEDADGDGIYTATINSPPIDRNYEIKTVIKYKDVSLDSETVFMVLVVDPEGYVYEKTGSKETRLQDVKVSIYWLNPEGPGGYPKYELWPAPKYQQENPQITDNTGKYSFLVPEGNYYITAEVQDYLPYKSDEFQVSEGSGVHINIELKPKNIWLRIFTVERILLGVIAMLLLAVLTVMIVLLRKKSTNSIIK